MCLCGYVHTVLMMGAENMAVGDVKWDLVSLHLIMVTILTKEVNY